MKSQIYVLVTVALVSPACATLPHPAADTHSSLRAPTSQTSARININTASTQELERLPGIGKVIAERIVEHRDMYGSFQRAEHLMMVRGLSDQKFRTLRGLITTE